MTLLSLETTVQSETNHCDRRITILSDTDLSLVCLIYLLILIFSLGDSK